MWIFGTIALTIYILINTYIFLKGYNSWQVFRNSGLVFLIIFIILAATFVAGKILEAKHSSIISDILNIIGGFWLAFLFYGFLFLFLSDLISVILRIVGIIDKGNILVFRKWAFLLTVTISFLMIAGGFVNALIPHIRRYDLEIGKPAEGINELRIAAVSDIHLGSIIRKRSMRKLSGILDSLKPNLVLLLGDILDGEVGPVMRGDLLKYFDCPKCTHGLYAITGNHEYIGGAQRTIPYIESKGIRLLKDEVVEIAGGIQVIGRLDRDSERFTGKKRLALNDLVRKTDNSKPVILLDHQPFGYNESKKYGIDLELSGHTHNGQIWPLNIVSKWIYDLSYGYLKSGNTHFIVSSGFGLWGPRVRTCSKSEILFIRLKFQDHKNLTSNKPD